MKTTYEQKDLVRVDGKSFQKSRLFGNWQAKTVHRNKKAYSRKGKGNNSWDC